MTWVFKLNQRFKIQAQKLGKGQGGTGTRTTTHTGGRKEREAFHGHGRLLIGGEKDVLADNTVKEAAFDHGKRKDMWYSGNSNQAREWFPISLHHTDPARSFHYLSFLFCVFLLSVFLPLSPCSPFFYSQEDIFELLHVDKYGGGNEIPVKKY